MRCHLTLFQICSFRFDRSRGAPGGKKIQTELCIWQGSLLAEPLIAGLHIGGWQQDHCAEGFAGARKFRSSD
jgi:hypothetical protein